MHYYFVVGINSKKEIILIINTSLKYLIYPLMVGRIERDGLDIIVYEVFDVFEFDFRENLFKWLRDCGISREKGEVKCLEWFNYFKEVLKLP